MLLAGGAENPRDLNVPGRELKGIHFAMEFLPQQNKRIAGDTVSDQILATGKRVVIIGGGDTGADCLGTCHRQKAEVRAPVRNHAHAARASAPRARRGRSGRCSCAPKARTKKAACAIGRCNTARFTGDAARQREAAARHSRRPAAEVRAHARHRNFRWTWIWSCWPWASPVRSKQGHDRAIRRGSSIRAATSPRTPIT